MKLEDFLKQGAVVKNPNYEKPSKKNPYGSPKYIVSNNYKDSLGFENNIGQHLGRYSKGLTHLNVDKNKYEDYDVFINPVNTEEELKLERAKNQGLLEQYSNMGVQLGSEIILGGFLATSDLIDAAIELVNKEDNDYSSAVSKWLIDQKEDIRKRYEIYQENPGQNWAIFDSGWWANNMVSFGSSLSLALPSATIVKGLGALSKLSKLSKVTKGIAKAANATKIVKYPSTFAKNLDNFTEILTSSFLSRTAENYLEARDVWEHNYDEGLRKLQSMSSEERKRFFELNPTFIGKTDEEIAKLMAGESADQTFRKDYAMLLFDYAQFKGINSIWKGSINKKSTAGLRLTNKQAIDRFADIAEENIQEITRWAKFKDGLKYAVTHPRQSIAALELSEGVEEFYQGVQIEEGKARGERFFDPTYNNSIGDYIFDGALWEQAVWGALGGIVFQKGGTFIGDKYNAVVNKIKNKNLTDKEANLKNLTEEKIRENEILGRAAIINKYMEQMDLVNKGENPFEIERDLVTGDPIVEYGEYVHKPLKDDESKSKEEKKQLYKDIITDRFIKDLTEEAVNSGNFDLLKEFISDVKVSTKLKNAGFNINNSDIKFEESLLDKMEKHADTYTKILSDVIENVDVDNEYLAKNLARQITQNISIIDEANKWISDIDDVIAKEKDSNKINNYFEEKVLTKYVINALNHLNNAESDILSMKYHGGRPLSDDAIAEYKKDINKRRFAYINMLVKQSPYFAAKYASLNANNKRTFLEKLKDETTEVYDRDPVDYNGYSMMSFINKDYLDTVKNNEYSGKDLNVLENIIKDWNEELTKETEKDNTRLKDEDITTPIAINLANKFNLLKDIVIAESNIPSTKTEYKDMYEQLNKHLDKRLKEKYEKAENNIAEWLDKQEDLDKAKEDLYKGNIPDNLKESLSIVKLGHHSTIDYANRLDATIKLLKEKRIREKEKRDEEKNTVTVNNSKKVLPKEERIEQTSVITEQKNPVNEIVDEVVKSVSSTGKLSEQPKDLPELTQQIQKDVEKIVDPNERGVVAENENELYEDKQVVLTKLYSVPFIKVANANKELFDSFETAESTPDVLNTIIDLFKKEANLPENTTKEFIRPFVISALKALNIRGNRPKLVQHAEAIISGIVGNDIYSATVLTEEERDEHVEEFIKAYVKDKGFPENKKIIIDFVTLLDDLKNNYNIDFVTAKYILLNIKNYVESDTAKKKYVFTNKKVLNKIVKSPQTFIKELIEKRTTIENVATYMHISSPTNTSSNYIDTIKNLKADDKIDISRIGNSISFKHNGVEIGYVGTVKKLNDTSTEFQLESLTSGFHYKVKKENNKYTSNADDYFNAIINPSNSDEDAKKLSKDIYDLKIYFIEVAEGIIEEDKQLEEKYYKSIILNEHTQNLIKNGVFKMPLNRNGNELKETTKGKIIYEAVVNILNYESNPSVDEMLESYGNWITSVYQNYENTHIIQKKLPNRNSGLTASIKNLSNKNASFTENPINIKDIASVEKVKYDDGKYKTVYVNSDGVIVSDIDATTHINYTDMEPGSMGLFLEEHGNAPIVAWFTESNYVEDTELGNLLKTELTNLLNGFLSGEIPFTVLHEKLVKLLGGPNYTTDNIFTGYDVMLHDDKILLSIKGEDKKYSLHIYNGGDTKINLINYIPDGNVEKAKLYMNDGNADVDGIVNDLMSRITFNRTFFALRNKDNAPTELIEGEYIQKNKNNNIVVTIGGKQIIYNNFLHLVLNNNAFKTNFSGWTYEGKAKSLYIDVNSITSPVEGIPQVKTLKELVDDKSFTKDKPLSSRTIINSLGFDKIPIDVLYGENGTIELLPREIYYDGKNNIGDAHYSKKDNKIYLHKSALSKDKSSMELIRMIIHERIHQQFVNTGLNKKDSIVTDLLDVYNVFIKSIENDLNNEDKSSERYKLAERIKKWLDHNNFNIENYGRLINKDKDPKRAEEKFKKNWVSKSQEEKERIFAEEWLAESLTRKDIINYLNTTEYNGKEIIVENIDFKKKSLWQKIIDALIKLFGINNKNIKNNSILAQQYKILGDIATNEETPIIVKKEQIVDKVETDDSKKEQDIEITEEDIFETEIPQDEIDNLNQFGDSNELEKNIEIDTEADYDDTPFSATKDIYTEEERNILANALRDSKGRLLAPNGKPSNLNERQYAQVRTKAFKDWAGDWLGFAEVDVIMPIGTSGSGKSTWIKSLPNLNNIIIISPDEMRVEFTGDMNNKTKDDEIYIEAAKRAIKAIKDGKKVIFDTTNLRKDRRLPFIDEIYKELPNANIKYKLMPLNAEVAKQRIKNDIERGVNRANVSPETIDRHAASYKQMLEDIKTENPTVLEDFTKVIDENGEPLIVYHGGSLVNIFDTTGKYHSAGIKKGDVGVYFTTSENDARNYESIHDYKYGDALSIIIDELTEQGLSKEQILKEYGDSLLGVQSGTRAFFLNIRNPKKTQYSGNNKIGYSKIDVNINNNDGQIIQRTDTSIIEYVAKKPNQIKSATDNVGTFSKESNDVYYSATETIIETYKEDVSVNPNGVRLINDMDIFVNTFSSTDKPLIAKMISNNEIKFSC